MNLVHRIIRSCAATCVALTLVACGSGSGDGNSTPTTGTLVGTAGGTVVGPNGAKLEIPPGALAADTVIAIEESSVGAPALPGTSSASGAMVALTPHGTTFAVPVTLTLPFEQATLPAGTLRRLLKTNASNEWEPVPGAGVGATDVRAQIRSFSHAQVVTQPFTPVQLLRKVSFEPLGEATESRDYGDGVVDERRLVGPAGVFEIPIDGDNTSALEAFSSDDGLPFWVGSESGKGRVRLTQSQSFVKERDDATLEIVVTAALVEALDLNGPATLDECPHGTGNTFTCQPIGAFATFEAEVTTVSADGEDWLYALDGDTPVLDTGGVIHLVGAAGAFGGGVMEAWPRTTEAFKDALFENTLDSLGNSRQAQARIRLLAPLVIQVDLSTLERNKIFWINTILQTSTRNRRQRESGVGAFVRDPLRTGGAVMNFTGLTPTAATRPAVRAPRRPVSCAGGPDPEAGVLQFSAPSYRVLEDRRDALEPSAIQITRTGGSKGAVSATFNAGGGNATPGVHYTPRSGTVFFADGDTGPHTVGIELLQNSLVEPDTTVDLTLSSPGGCATLGATASAVLTILDDDGPPPPPPRPSPGGSLDTTFGIGGKATLERFGGDRSGMALQADGKIVMVGGTFVDFVLARFNADGSIDTAFGVDGKVTTDMGSGLRQEEALAVAIQSDGKIVVVGHTAIDATPPAPDLPSTFAIARFNADGSLDTGFGTGGRVSGNVNGIARAVAIQPDGKIVLAGDFELALSNGTFVSDFTVARFNADGSLDLAFGSAGSGQVATDIGQAFNTASNVVLQPNGAIVVSGKANCSQVGCDHTDVVRYSASGTLDASFGNGGKLTLAGKLVGEGLARQADGKLVLAGSVTLAGVPTFSLMRLNVDGTIDAGFGTAGTVDTPLTEGATANGVALQADGKIVCVGTRALAANPNFIVARYLGDGSLDPGFGIDGSLSIDFFGFGDAGENVLIQPDGKIVVGGLARNNVDGYGVARINP